MNKLKKCPFCKKYTLNNACPECKKPTKDAHYKYIKIKSPPNKA